MTDYPSKKTMARQIAALLPMFLLGMLVSACNGSDSEAKSFSDANAALEDYEAFLRSVSKQKTLSNSELVSSVLEWKALDDSVTAAMFRDSVHTNRAVVDSTYFSLRDSITDKLTSLVDRIGIDKIIQFSIFD